MKVWTDERGINIRWDRRRRVPVPGRGAAAALAGLGLGYAVSDAVISNAANAPGSWLTWQAITFIAGLIMWVAGLFLFAYRVVVPAARTPHRLRLGEVYLSELPGVLLVLLAGAEYRRALAGILERRAKKADMVLLKPEPRPVTRTNCIGCGTPEPVARGRCKHCYEMHAMRVLSQYPKQRDPDPEETKR